tara:strand:+ start:630 stop:1124 length:495 start_codon:yes stop_codon:yes gene_type:complete
MATPTYEAIATNTLVSPSATVTFSSIAADWTDLVIVQTFPNNEIYGYTTFRYNGDTSSNYSLTTVYGYSTATSGREANVTFIRLGTSSYMSNSNTITHIQNYSNTTTYKTSISRYNFGQTNGSPKDVGATVGMWRETDAISSIELSISSGTYAAGSTFTLYGVL